MKTFVPGVVGTPFLSTGTSIEQPLKKRLITINSKHQWLTLSNLGCSPRSHNLLCSRTCSCSASILVKAQRVLRLYCGFCYLVLFFIELGRCKVHRKWFQLFMQVSIASHSWTNQGRSLILGDKKKYFIQSYVLEDFYCCKSLSPGVPSLYINKRGERKERTQWPHSKIQHSRPSSVPFLWTRTWTLPTWGNMYIFGSPLWAEDRAGSVTVMRYQAQGNLER